MSKPKLQTIEAIAHRAGCTVHEARIAAAVVDVSPTTVRTVPLFDEAAAKVISRQAIASHPAKPAGSHA